MKTAPTLSALKNARTAEQLEMLRAQTLPSPRPAPTPPQPAAETPIRHAWLNWQRLLSPQEKLLLPPTDTIQDIQALIAVNQKRLACLRQSAHLDTVLIKEQAWRDLLSGHLNHALMLAERDEHNALNQALDHATDRNAALLRHALSRRVQRTHRLTTYNQSLAADAHNRLLSAQELTPRPLAPLTDPWHNAFHVLEGARWAQRYAIVHIVGHDAVPLCQNAVLLQMQRPSRTTSLTLCPHCQDIYHSRP